MTYEAIRYDEAGAVATITLNRPKARNAFNRALERDLLHAFQYVSEATHIRAVVITGAGRSFCAGADLKAFDEVPEGGDPTMSKAERVYHLIMTAYGPMTKLLMTMPKPVIGAINGAAAGAGCSLALACDLRIMADNAFLLQAFSTIALVPDAGSTWLMARQIGYSRAYQVAIEAERLDAQTCLGWGLTNKVVAADALLETAQTWAAQLAERPAGALALTKHLMQRAMTSSIDEMIEQEAHFQKQCVESADHGEGIAAFIEKRLPRFNTP